MNTTNKTRANLRQANHEERYEVTTQEAQQFLADKFRAAGINVAPMLNSISISKVFHPIMLILPATSDIVHGMGENKQHKGLSIFDTDSKKGGLRLQQNVFNIVKKYTYTPEDMEAFKSKMLRDQLKLTNTAIQELQARRVPKEIVVGERSKTRLIVVLIDPLRLFFDMSADPSAKYDGFTIQVNIDKVISEGNTNYKLVKRPKTNNRFSEDINKLIANELNRRIR